MSTDATPAPHDPTEPMGPGDAMGTITYRAPDGQLRTWGVGCHATRDTEATLQAHLARCMPDATFISATIVPVDRSPTRD